MLVAGLVVEDRLALHRVLGVGDRDRPAVAARRGLARELERVERRPRVAARARGEEGDRLVVDRRLAALAAVERAPQQPLDVRRLQRVQLVDLGAREQRGVDLEVRVLGRRPDERDQPLLDGGQQRVLLRLVEAVDLVEEEDRRAPGVAPLARPRDHLADLRPPRVDGRELLEGGVGVLGGHPRQRRLAGARRAVQDHRVRVAGLDRRAQRRALAEQVLLADEVVERARAHPRRERPADRRRLGPRLVAPRAPAPARTACPRLQYRAR